MVGVAVVDEVDWCNPNKQLKPVERRVHTDSVRAKVITYETVHLREVTAVKGAKVK